MLPKMQIFGFLHRLNYLIIVSTIVFTFKKNYHCSEWMIFVAPLRRYFFPILDSVDRKKKDFCINLRHVMRSDVIRSNERIHGIILLHHKIWQKFPLFVHWKIEIDNLSSNNSFLHFQRAFNGIIHLFILKKKMDFWAIFWS